VEQALRQRGGASKGQWTAQWWSYLFMNSVDIIGLFAEPTQASRPPYSWALSFLFHCGVAAVLIVGVMFHPKIREAPLEQRYAVRLMELHMPTPQLPRLESADAYLAPLAVSALRLATQPGTAPSTLLQRNVPPKLLLPKEVSLPSVIMRSPEETTLRFIVPAPHQENAAPNVRPTMELPNDEVNLAEIKIASTASGVETLKVLPSTTSPVAGRKPQAVEKLPETGSNSTGQPTPATLLSLSDVRMMEGTVALPFANQIGSAPGPQGSLRDSAVADHGHSAGSSDSNSDNALSTKRITPPKTGKFGMVVVGASLEEDYPEIAGVWNGRLAYTVYLHVGQAKNWILQYSLPLTSESTATGSAAHLEAPWPTDMLVPKFGPDSINADAVLAHGFLNQRGRFENLAIVFPPQLTLARFVLDTLAQWQFRPAQQNGRAVPVEVLLIIPEMPE
jgi:hypothetical protein